MHQLPVPLLKESFLSQRVDIFPCMKIPLSEANLADVPVWEFVHFPYRSVVVIFLSLNCFEPELNVEAIEEEHGSEYQGIFPFSDAELTLKVKGDVV